MIVFKKPLEFEWDEGNQDKNWRKHRVSINEAESVFFDKTRKLSRDYLHSKTEKRFLLIGKTKQERKLMIVFTQRHNKIRIISARDLNKKEYYLLRKET